MTPVRKVFEELGGVAYLAALLALDRAPRLRAARQHVAALSRAPGAAQHVHDLGGHAAPPERLFDERPMLRTEHLDEASSGRAHAGDKPGQERERIGGQCAGVHPRPFALAEHASGIAGVHGFPMPAPMRTARPRARRPRP